MADQAKPFARSLNDRMLAGVMGGIAHRFGWNSTLLRAVFVIVSIARCRNCASVNDRFLRAI